LTKQSHGEQSRTLTGVEKGAEGEKGEQKDGRTASADDTEGL